jgi:hypothetical protein
MEPTLDQPVQEIPLRATYEAPVIVDYGSAADLTQALSQ